MQFRMGNRLALGSLLLPLSMWLGMTVAVAEPTPAAPNSAILFDVIVPALKKQRIPLRLPTYVPATNSGPPKTPSYIKLPLQVTLDSISSEEYTIFLSYTPNCGGGNVCRIGTVSAEKITPKTPMVQKEYTFEIDPKYPGHKSTEPFGKVTLAKGIQGYFIPWICGANCSDAKVVWDENGYRYWVGIKVGDKESLVKMANSAIMNKVKAL